ncbi:hypothetical protein K2173_005449 [Erythroxylum novogranatense]|uniref:Homologous recombination OB-fold protein OB-fold domain-containing protein n=1 Tax=Erythroxylum novogranatense TaxID=1862640 RepID=A0AAV8SK13_9ROSI|nr:hypothetical protein K2173_005449 [Erythroxylum novogranatense]
MDDEQWEESLDLDDSELPSLRHLNHRTPTTTAETATVVSLPQPFLQPCSLLPLPSQNRQTLSSPNPPPRLIPGPAGVVQAAMKRRKHQIENPIPTQEYIKRAVEDGVGDEDDDFSRGPWLASVDFIRRQGLVIDGDGAIGVPLSAIKNGVVNLDDKVTQVVAIVKSCKPNGLGDLMVTLKDPTASIDASVHRGVFSNNEFGKDISVGAVMILKNIAIFAPTRHVHYLNITVRNVVKVISKDGGGLSTQSGCSATLKSKEGGDIGNEVIMKSLGYESNGRDNESVAGDSGALLTLSGCSATFKSKEVANRGNEVIMKSLGFGREIESVGGDSGGLLTQSGCSATLKSKDGGDRGAEVQRDW